MFVIHMWMRVKGVFMAFDRTQVVGNLCRRHGQAFKPNTMTNETLIMHVTFVF